MKQQVSDIPVPGLDKFVSADMKRAATDHAIKIVKEEGISKIKFFRHL
jgi:hypothetical protein